MNSDELERADCDVAEMMLSMYNYPQMAVLFWLVVLTILKNISQWEGLSHIGKNMFQTTNQFVISSCHGCVGGQIPATSAWGLTLGTSRRLPPF